MQAISWATAFLVRQDGRLFSKTSLLLLDGAQREGKCRDEWQHLKGLWCMQSVSCAHD